MAGAIAAALGWFALQPSRPSAAQELFDPQTVIELRLTIGTEEQQSLTTSPRRYVPGTLHYAGRDYPTALHIKGHRSKRKLGNKPAFKLQFDRYEAPGRFLGLRKLNLNNLVEDPTRMREVLSYSLLEKLKLPHPRAAYARLFVNNRPQGVYLIVESLDDDFATDRFGESHGPLYEGAYGCDLQTDDVEGFDLDAGQDPDQRKLRAFVQRVHQDPEQLFDPTLGPLAMDQFLAFLAFSALVGDFDGYRHSHNYYLYQDPEHKRWQFIPWGLDRALKKRLPIYDSNGLLAKLCFADPNCRLQYARTLKGVTAQFEEMHLERQVAQLSEILQQAGTEGEPATHSLQKAKRATDKLLKFLRERPQEVRAELGCLDENGQELDRDHDGFGCLDCDDRNSQIHPNALESCNGVDDNCSGRIDDAPGCPCESQKYGGQTYSLCTHEMTWAQAASFCAARGEQLARISSPSESRALYKAARKLDRQAWWIGYSDQKKEGKFRWTGGDQGEFAYWRDRQPDNGSCNQDCVVLMPKGDGRWNDTHCNQLHPFVCSPQ